MGMVLETVTGRLVDVENPLVEQIDIEDIAWGLSRIARFCGATITPIPYNVAQHSLLVAKKVEEDIERWGWSMAEANGAGFETILKALLHDASEVYTGDVPSPVKKIPSLHPVFKELEHKLMEKIYEKYKLSPNSSFEDMLIKNADKWAQKVEAHAFMPSRGSHWEGMPEVTLEELQSFEEPLPALQSYKMFKSRFEELIETCG
jgi:uncharacterized protein